MHTTAIRLYCRSNLLHWQVLLENAHRGSAPTNGSDAGGAVPPRVSGVPATLPLVSIPSKKIEEIYLQARRPGSLSIVRAFVSIVRTFADRPTDAAALIQMKHRLPAQCCADVGTLAGCG